MVDNFVRSQRGASMVNYRPDDSVLYARRMVRLPDDVSRGRPQLQTQPQSQAQVQPQPSSVVPEAEPIAQPVPFVATDTQQALVQIGKLEAETILVPPITQEAPANSTEKQPKPTQNTPKQPRHHLSFRHVAAALVAMVVLALTGYVSLDTWMTTSEVKQSIQQTAAATENKNSVVLGEGQDETDVQPSTIDRYTVAGDLPRVLTIPKLTLRARVLPMSVNADGALQAPVNIFDSGWYGASAKPGTSGASLIDGHASGATRQGLFAYLDTLTIGDKLSIERGDGQTFNYEVVNAETVPLADIDMSTLLKPYGATTEGLNLITCTGKWLPDQKTYDHRVTVYAKRV